MPRRTPKPEIVTPTISDALAEFFDGHGDLLKRNPDTAQVRALQYALMQSRSYPGRLDGQIGEFTRFGYQLFARYAEFRGQSPTAMLSERLGSQANAALYTILREGMEIDV